LELELERNQTQSPPSRLLPPHSPFTRLLNKPWQHFFFLSESQHDGKKLSAILEFFSEYPQAALAATPTSVESLNPIPAVNITFDERSGFGN
jgi:hypothetical protein